MNLWTNESAELAEPIVVDPPGFDPAAAWEECRSEVDRLGGLSHPDGEPNWLAAFSASPSVCSCPACGQMHWAWGRIQRCVACSFEYPTDWWPKFSWGSQAARRKDPESRESKLHTSRLDHPYYRYGFEHPVESPADARREIDWRAVMQEPRP